MDFLSIHPSILDHLSRPNFSDKTNHILMASTRFNLLSCIEKSLFLDRFPLEILLLLGSLCKAARESYFMALFGLKMSPVFRSNHIDYTVVVANPRIDLSSCPKQFNFYMCQKFSWLANIEFQDLNISESLILSVQSLKGLRSLSITDCIWEADCNIYLTHYEPLRNFLVSLMGFKGQLMPPSKLESLTVQVPLSPNTELEQQSSSPDILLDVLDCAALKHL